MTVIRGQRIYHTHGDYFEATVGLTNANGTTYVPDEGDRLFFILRPADGRGQIIEKEISTSTLTLVLTAAETEALGQGVVNGHYVYDLKLVKAGGKPDTFVNLADFYIMEDT